MFNVSGEGGGPEYSKPSEKRKVAPLPISQQNKNLNSPLGVEITLLNTYLTLPAIEETKLR